MSQVRIPAWISVGVLPAVNILLAFLVSAILFYYLDINPVDAAQIMWYGAFGTGEGVGFTLYYATGFIFTGLSVAVAFHAGLFNIGGEGQAYIGGLGCGLAVLALDGQRGELRWHDGRRNALLEVADASLRPEFRRLVHQHLN